MHQNKIHVSRTKSQSPGTEPQNKEVEVATKWQKNSNRELLGERGKQGRWIILFLIICDLFFYFFRDDAHVPKCK